MEEFNADCTGATDLPNDGTNNEAKLKIAESIGLCVFAGIKLRTTLNYLEKMVNDAQYKETVNALNKHYGIAPNPCFQKKFKMLIKLYHSLFQV